MTETRPDRRFVRLLLFLLAYLFLSPFIPEGATANLVVHLLLTLMLFSAAWAVQKQQGQRSIALGLVAAALVLYWLGVFKVVPFSAEGALVLFLSFYGMLIYAFIKQLLRATTVTKEVIAATLCLYLVIGLFWGSGYSLLAHLNEGAFSGALLENASTSPLHLFNYFSIVTLTTLGYGDITPQIPGAASLCQMEAIVGQFFTAVLVAWLVGTYKRPTQEPKQD
jgi:voltage-gated potassium channel